MRPLLLLAAVSALALSSCFSPGDGEAPPLNRLYFPTGVVLDSVNVDSKTGASKFMYVASSDFDLQYRSSSLAAFDLQRIAEVVPVNCNADADCASPKTCDTEASALNGYVPSFFCVSPGSDPCGSSDSRATEADKLLSPGRCKSVNIDNPQDGGSSLLVDTVGIGAFATDVILRPNPALPKTPARLFLPVRGDGTLHWIDLGTDGHFNCNQSSTDDNSCDGVHRVGNDPKENVNDIVQPPEPFGIAATTDGQYVTITNQTTGSVSLYSNGLANGGPKLESISSGFPTAPVTIAAVPQPALSPAQASSWSPGFLVAYSNAAQVDLLRLRGDDPSDVGHVVLGYAGSVPITANSIGFDSRSLVFDTDQRDEDYVACEQIAGCSGLDACQLNPAFLDCAKLARQPDVYLANRTPASLLVGALTPDQNFLAGSSELPSFTDNVALTAGPSRVVLGRVRVPSSSPDAIVTDGAPYVLERRVFVVCFDSRRVFIYDPKRRVIEARVITGRGPFALAVDDARGLAYIAHFTDSYLGVISLDQRFPKSYASIVANIGTPSPPRASK
ncbi:MAG: hypothetical protein ABI548_26515 [Polyangiaceae bacterium]